MEASRGVKAPVRALLQRLGWYESYQLARAGFLAESGWVRSMQEGRPVDREGRPLPWLSYAAITFLDRRLRPELQVFEYGAGASTLWWSERVARVVACEHDPVWLAEVARQARPNVELIERPLDAGESYARAIADYPGQFDVVVIDGRERVSCARHAVEALKPASVIVWDDTERPEYRPGIDALAVRGFRRLEFSGMAPGKLEAAETSVFYRDGNCLGI